MDPCLLSLSSLDGRYNKKTRELCEFLSESALIRYRIFVELKWLIFLAKNIYKHNSEFQLLNLNKDVSILEELITKIPIDSESKIKSIEATTNHDVKSVEYYLKEVLKKKGCSKITISMVHFACTSEDINNIAYALMLKECIQKVIIPTLSKNIISLKNMALSYQDIPMLSRTHGQAATPTTLGKELAVFAYRIHRQRQDLINMNILAKMNGAVGNYNAHVVCFSNMNWHEVSKDFIENILKLKQNPLTTQIEDHDWIASFCHNLSRINNICIDLCQDIWAYISLDYFVLKNLKHEVGSSTMPHKINPIDFENAEGNLGISNSLCLHLANKLPISRMQRDLSDSSALRALGSAIGYHFASQKSLHTGLGKISANVFTIKKDLENRWNLLAEPIQMMMRKNGLTDSYEKLKNFTRGREIHKSDIQSMIISLDLPEKDRTALMSLTPLNYIGSSNLYLKDILAKIN